MCVHLEREREREREMKLHAAGLTKITTRSNITVEKLYERVNFGHLGTDWRIILKWMEQI
jgi:hypothetical protein